MPNPTTNFGLLQPLVNNPTDQDLWGGYLNTSISNLDTLLLSAFTWNISAETSSFSIAGRTDGTTTLGGTKTFFLCNATGGAIVASLPAANTVDNGFTIAVKKSDSSAHTVTVTAAGSDTIDDAATLVIATQYDSFVLVCDGASKWEIQSYKHGITPKSFSVNFETFGTAGSFEYTPTAGIIGAIFEAQAGGGASSGCTGATQIGGASGGTYAQVYLTAAQITAALTTGFIAGVIGGGGVGGTNAPTNGTGGSATSLGSLFSCPGGLASTGTGGAASPGDPTVTTGQLLQKQPGQAGMTAFTASGGWGGGMGGDSAMGSGGPNSNVSGSSVVNGSQGTGCGSGAGGPCTNGGSAAGANGNDGFMKVTELIFA